MKVLVSAFQCAPGHGGEIGNGWSWATSLADYGHEVTVLTESEFKDQVVAGGRTDIDFRFIDPPSYIPIRLGGIDGYSMYRHWQHVAYEHAAALRGDWDVIHHTGWGSLHLGSKLWQLPAPLIYGPIGGGQTAPSAYRGYFGREWPIEKARSLATGSLLKVNGWAKETLRNSSVVLVTNSDTEAACRGLGARDIRYFLADGVPQQWIGTARQRPTGVPVILWVGRMLARKAPELAVQAFAELRKTMEARLVMAGDGPFLPRVRAAVERLGLTGDVELLGRVPWPQLAELYSSSSLFLFCSLRDSSSAQFLEALGKGLPAVTLDLHGIGDVKVGLAAEKVPLPSKPEQLPGDLAVAMRTVLTGDDWAARSAAAVEWASGQTFPHKAAAATRIYQEVCAR
jgi:glycosyltransferase involved in cell wall biosynthesis